MAESERKTPKLLEQDLAGKVAIVTGATQGIGRAICINLATRGASIIGTYISSASSELFSSLTASITSLYASSTLSCPKLIGIEADITISTTPYLIIHALRTHFSGTVDIVVFNAAVMGLARMGEGAVDEEFVSRALVGNVTFPIMLMENLVSTSCIKENGRVVAISSEGVRARRPPGGSVYAATKSAIECLMRKWADELGTHPSMTGTTFNSVSVGFTKTEAYHRMASDMRDRLTASDAEEVAVAHRIGEVEDVADVVGLLVSEKARWISGSVVDASGGKAKIM
ncbi:short-chain dehydrogenase [Amniculicola lignicola CBS 123094]|uniref:Short-chain dehydrogenase n=1 Tax=Amniculicola lignicola CBS 123094 TaxID=1392246 RepID=A0A6A5WLC1_9PLEO|nr:short-chain dehydrogenase [Amniculicola lignicola CBS 123094]